MERKVKYIAILIFAASFQLMASQKYCVYFTDKAGTTFDAETYFVNKRSKSLHPIDSTDFPLNNQYKAAVENISGKISSESRWLNAVVIKANDSQIDKIAQLNFVKEIQPLDATVKLAKYKFKATLHSEAYTIMSGQVTSMQGELFEQNNIDGKGIRIAIFDAGFIGVDKSPVFEHLRKNGHIVKTYDFVNKKEDVYGHNLHGTMVLSCIAGKIDGANLGMATGAKFLLARTESNFETLSEEEFWMEAVEWAYRNGADIINSSLGYTYHRYFEKDMDGKTSLVAKAATLATEKGMLVVNAMGNDGNNHWQYMCTPADVENVMAVGGIDPNTGIHIPFSSFGPTADKRMKPNVSAYAHVVTGSNNKLAEAYGTSFASPLVAGFAACVLQLNPNYEIETLFEEIEKSGNLYPYFDYAHGYGIPQAGYFIQNDTEENTDIQFIESNNEITVNTNGKNGLLYYHIQQPNGPLVKYSVVEITESQTLTLSKEITEGNILRVHFKNSTIEKQY